MRFIFVFIFTALFSLGANARDVRLFQNGEQVPDYKDLINKLSHKERFQERTFFWFDALPPIEVVQFLGHGGLTAVFLRADGRVLRVPLSDGNAFFRTGPGGELRDHGPYTDAMEEYYEAMKELDGVDEWIPKIYDNDTRLPMYITVDYFGALFNVADFFKNRERMIIDGLMTAKQVSHLEAEFEAFVRSFAIYEMIGDFKTSQIMSDGKTWKLLDLSTGIRVYHHIDDQSPFDHRNMGPKLPENIWTWIKKIVRDERQQCDRLLGPAV